MKDFAFVPAFGEPETMLSDARAGGSPASRLQSLLAPSLRFCGEPAESRGAPIPGVARGEQAGLLSGCVCCSPHLRTGCRGRTLPFHKPLFVTADGGRARRAPVASGSGLEWEGCSAGRRLVPGCVETGSGAAQVTGQSGREFSPLRGCGMVFLVNRQK